MLSPLLDAPAALPASCSMVSPGNKGFGVLKTWGSSMGVCHKAQALRHVIVVSCMYIAFCSESVSDGEAAGKESLVRKSVLMGNA